MINGSANILDEKMKISVLDRKLGAKVNHSDPMSKIKCSCLAES